MKARQDEPLSAAAPALEAGEPLVIGGHVTCPDRPERAAAAHTAGLPAYARRAESAAFDELWLAEDCFFAGGIAAVSAALSSTHG